MRLEGRNLAFKPQDGARYQCLARQMTSIVEQEPGVEIVRPVGNHVIIVNQPHDVGFRKALFVSDQPNTWIDLSDRGLGAFDFCFPYSACCVNHLTLQIGQIDHVVIDHTQRSDAGSGQVEGQRGAQASGPDT